MSSNSWTKLRQCPNKLVNEPIRTGTDTFVVLSYNNGIWQYKVKENEWTQIMKYVSEFQSLTAISYNTNKTIIHVLDNRSNLFQISLQTKQMKKLTNIPFETVGWSPSLFYINNKLHIIAHTPEICIHHLIADLGKKDLQTIHTFQYKTITHAAIYLPARQRIVVFTYERIMEYCVLTNQWTIHVPSFKFPLITGLIADKHQQFIVIPIEWHTGPRIIVYNITTRNMSFSSYKPATKRKYVGIMMDDPERDNLIVFGYVHDCFTRKEFDQIPELPFYLIRLIGKWICNEQLHLFSVTTCLNTWAMVHHHNGKHWKISLDDVLKGTFENYFDLTT